MKLASVSRISSTQTHQMSPVTHKLDPVWGIPLLCGRPTSTFPHDTLEGGERNI